MTVMMKCGHSANARTKSGDPACAICAGFDDKGLQVDENYVHPEGRKARCTYFQYCKTEVDSNTDLAFFKAWADSEFDEFYCGCHGWD